MRTPAERTLTEQRELAARIGLSPSACLRRVKALETEQIIVGYTALLDEKRVGLNYEPLV